MRERAQMLMFDDAVSDDDIMMARACECERAKRMRDERRGYAAAARSERRDDTADAPLLSPLKMASLRHFTLLAPPRHDYHFDYAWPCRSAIVTWLSLRQLAIAAAMLLSFSAFTLFRHAAICLR